MLETVKREVTKQSRVNAGKKKRRALLRTRESREEKQAALSFYCRRREKGGRKLLLCLLASAARTGRVNSCAVYIHLMSVERREENLPPGQDRPFKVGF